MFASARTSPTGTSVRYVNLDRANSVIAAEHSDGRFYAKVLLDHGDSWVGDDAGYDDAGDCNAAIETLLGI